MPLSNQMNGTTMNKQSHDTQNKNEGPIRVVVDVDEDGDVVVYSSDRSIDVCSRYVHKTGETLWWHPTQHMPIGWMDPNIARESDE